MNYKSIGRFIAQILAVEALFLLPALVLSLVYKEPAATRAYLMTLAIVLVLAGLLYLATRGAKANIYEKEGLACAGISWLVLGPSLRPRRALSRPGHPS